jgi:hypothetical protein
MRLCASRLLPTLGLAFGMSGCNGGDLFERLPSISRLRLKKSPGFPRGISTGQTTASRRKAQGSEQSLARIRS